MPRWLDPHMKFQGFVPKCRRGDLFALQPVAVKVGDSELTHWREKKISVTLASHLRAEYVHACMHACMHTYMHAYLHACMHAYMHACMHRCIDA